MSTLYAYELDIPDVEFEFAMRIQPSSSEYLFDITSICRLSYEVDLPSSPAPPSEGTPSIGNHKIQVIQR